ncbi:MAG: sensor histidine kinase [Actinomycetes bacterium]
MNSSARDVPALSPITQRPRGGPFTRWPRVADAVLAVGVVLTGVVVSPDEPDDEFALRAVGEVPFAEFVVLLVASGALYWRRPRPVVVLGVTLAASALSTALRWSDLVGVAMLVALYSVGRYAGDQRWSRISLAGVLAFVTVSSIIDAATVAEIGFGLCLTFSLWYVGRRLRMRGERAAQLQREQAAEARRAVAEERTRIARELHDIVAHRVSLMTVQAGAAKTVAGVDPEGAVQAMAEVEQAGRQALDELRHLLGVLRPDTEAEALGPQPRLADVPRLVSEFRAAGLDASLTMDAPQVMLPARVDLSAYRIVQEALTNALKHAGTGARTDVRVRSDDDGLVIEVTDSGRGVTTLPGSGHGIIGMRERALLLGGRLEAGPRPGGGFQVVAHLPLSGEPV